MHYFDYYVIILRENANGRVRDGLTSLNQADSVEFDGRLFMTKGQKEAKICEVITRFEAEYMGRGPKRINAKIMDDVIFVRQWGFLTLAEESLAETNDGTELIKKVRSRLFEKVNTRFRNSINEVIDSNIISIHSDVSTITGEKIIVVTFDENIEEKFFGN